MRILIYAEVNLNISGGPTLWVSSSAELFGGAEGVDVDVLFMSPVERRDVIAEVALDRPVRFIDPWTWAATSSAWQRIVERATKRRLSAAGAAEAIGLLHQERTYDLLAIRSMDTCFELCDQPELGRRMWVYAADPEPYRSSSELLKLKRVLSKCRRFLCQTEEARDAFAAMVPSASAKMSLLPPMIDSIVRGSERTRNDRPPRLGYAGKFSKGYYIPEMLDAFRDIRRAIPNAEFHVVGDHFRSNKVFADEVRHRLCSTPGVIWHGGMSRTETAAILDQVDVASSWRDEQFDANLELSTKVLEYAALGLPVLMNPSSIHRRVFGPAYPGFVETSDEFVDRFLNLVSSPELYRTAVDQLQLTAEAFTIPRRREDLIPLAREDAAVLRQKPADLAQGAGRDRQSAGPSHDRSLRVLVTGRDFKFMHPLLTHFEDDDRYELKTESWAERAPRVLTLRPVADPWPDLIFCEWCHANAEWYSWHKHPHQRLIIRLHRFEMTLPYIHSINWDNVDRLIFVTTFYRDRFLEQFPAMEGRAIVIRNMAECGELDREKRPGSEFAMGILGYLPRLKAIHLAFRLLEQLWQHDDRYRLWIKGLQPWQLPWVWRTPEERGYYETLYEEIRRSEAVQGVVFCPHDREIAEWFTNVGIVLSTSEIESCHLAVVEGMASGAVPVIRGWAGAEWQYPGHSILPYDEDAFVEAAVEAILGRRVPEVYVPASRAAKRFARDHFDVAVILAQFDTLIAEVLEDMHRTTAVAV